MRRTASIDSEGTYKEDKISSGAISASLFTRLARPENECIQVHYARDNGQDFN
jgi:hypothetical protein